MVKDKLGGPLPWRGFISPVFYKTGPLACPYLPDRIERRVLTELPAGPSGQALFDRLSQEGFRRIHRQLYFPNCPGCSACVPVRIVAAKFAPNRSLRKAVRRMTSCRRQVIAAAATAEQFELFKAYQNRRHADSDMRLMHWDDYAAMIERTDIDTRLLQIRCPEGQLIGCCLFDSLQNGLSAVYSFFAEASGGIGVGSILINDLVRLALAENRDYVYLGFWIAACAKMAYKIRFQPLEKMTRRGWAPLAPPVK